MIKSAKLNHVGKEFLIHWLKVSHVDFNRLNKRNIAKIEIDIEYSFMNDGWIGRYELPEGLYQKCGSG